jgi:hypothetical protein
VEDEARAEAEQNGEDYPDEEDINDVVDNVIGK